MNRIILAVLILAGFASCGSCEEKQAINKSPFAFVQGAIMSNEYVQYQSDMAKIEDSYKKGEISKEKYEEMKSDAENTYKASKARQ